MSRVLEYRTKENWNEYLQKSQKYQSSSVRTFLLFMFIAIVCYISFFIYLSNTVALVVIVFLSLFFISLLLYNMYRIERKYRGITATFAYFLQTARSTVNHAASTWTGISMPQ